MAPRRCARSWGDLSMMQATTTSVYPGRHVVGTWWNSLCVLGTTDKEARMRSTATLQSTTPRRSPRPRRRYRQGTAGAPTWWDRERADAQSTTRMLSGALLTGLIGWSVVLAALVARLAH